LRTRKLSLSNKYNFLLDENVSKRLKTFLKDRGHYVKTVQDLNKRSIKNNDLLKLSRETKDILITYDKDFIYKKYQKEDYLIIIDIHPLIDDNVIPAFEKLLKNLSVSDMKDNILILYENNYKLKSKF